MDELTQIARARAAVLGLPTQALEDWRYVRCETLKEAAYDDQRALTAEEHNRFVQPHQPGLVWVDGQLQPRASGSWPVTWQDAPELADQGTALAEEQDHAVVWAFCARESAGESAGESTGGTPTALRISGDAGAPLHLTNIATGGTSGWSLVVDVAPSTRLELVIRHIALGKARSCPAITLRLGHAAQAQVSEVQASSWHHLLATATLEVAADAQAQWTSVAQGGACVRLTTRATLTGRGAHLALAGLAEVRDRDQAHHLVRVVHAAGHTTSEQLFKSILHDRAQTSFDGLVQIRSGCDGADATQQNRNLVLSDLAKADTRPQLDIKADDVKAAHGATVGQLDADELFYLRCRGLLRQDAEKLLTIGFIGEVLARLPHRQALDSLLGSLLGDKAAPPQSKAAP